MKQELWNAEIIREQLDFFELQYSMVKSINWHTVIDQGQF